MRAPSMAFLDYMGVAVRRASSHIPTSKEMLEMHFWPTTGLTFTLITLVPEHSAGWGTVADAGPFHGLLGLYGHCRASSHIPTSAKLIEIHLQVMSRQRN